MRRKPTDPELLREWLEQGHEGAFRDLVTRYAGLVQATALRSCADPTMAADVSQLVFIQLARKGRKLMACKSIGGWLHKTTQFQSMNFLRQQCREERKRQTLHAAMESPTTKPSSPAWEEMQPLLDKALASLSRNDREVIILRYYRSLSIRELAEVIGIGVEAAQKRVNRATERLRFKMMGRPGQSDTAFSTTLLAGFSADAEVLAQAVSAFTSKALASGMAGVGATTGATFLSTVTVMKIKYVIVPFLVISAGGVWLASQQNSIARLEEESSELNQAIRVAELRQVSSIRKSGPGSAIVSKHSPFDWPKFARLLVTFGRPDGVLVLHDRAAFSQMASRVDEMGREGLVAALGEIDHLKLPKNDRRILERHLEYKLVKIDPEWVLSRVFDRTGSGDGKGNSRMGSDDFGVVSSALSVWAKRDPMAAGAWLDGVIADGLLEGKSLGSTQKYRAILEGCLIGMMLDVDPQSASARLASMPAGTRREALSVVRADGLDSSQQDAFANLVRKHLPEQEWARAFASQMHHFTLGEDLSPASGFLARIEATPEERHLCVRQVSASWLQKKTYKRQVTLDDLTEIDEWASDQSPDSKISFAGYAFASIPVDGRGMSAKEICDLALRYYDERGNDAFLIPLIRTRIGDPAFDQAQLLRLREAIPEGERRAAIFADSE